MSESTPLEAGYNERLFAKRGLRSFYHLARFNWAAGEIRKHLGANLKVVELGCFDGRLLEHIEPQVAEYVGLDANWEGGLDLARERFRGRPTANFIESSDPAALHEFPAGYFDLAVALETLEHLDPGMVPAYLDELARVTSGRILVSVPNEIGPVFLAKHLVKSLRYGATEHYTPREFVAAVLGRTERIARNQHKGFDFRQLIRSIGSRFEIISVTGLPRLGLPPGLSATVAIQARTTTPA